MLPAILETKARGRRVLPKVTGRRDRAASGTQGHSSQEEDLAAEPPAGAALPPVPAPSANRVTGSWPRPPVPPRARVPLGQPVLVGASALQVTPFQFWCQEESLGFDIGAARFPIPLRHLLTVGPQAQH